jgi:TP901 family phage tail tape measure protein
VAGARRIVVEFIGDGKNLSGELNNLQGKTSKFGAFMGKAAKAGAIGLAGGLALVAKSAVGLEAEFSKTMNVLQATTGAPQREMKELSKLAMKMGADTVFSANDASQAMLELARGGMTAATIRGGALQGTLTLAAAGELDMATAANIAVKSMGQFNLKGKDMAGVAAALAGGANASSASVGDMATALAQGGLAANSVGFSLQETTGILAAFSNAGLEGSDAGTSLKTTLDRLQPTTASQKEAMKALGVITKDGTNEFIKANGEFKSAAEVAEVLKQGTEDLTEAERKRLITAAFGSDAQRGATILAKEGAAGIKEMTKATSDQSAAEELAAANMKGTAGAIEKLKGAAETAALKIGLALAPTVRAIADTLSEKVIPAVTKFIAQMQNGQGAGGKFADVLGQLRDALVKAWGILKPVIEFMANNKAVVATFAGVILTVVAAVKAWSVAQAILNVVMSANPIGIVVVAIAALAAGLVYAYKKSETFRTAVNTAWAVLKKFIGFTPFGTLLAALGNISGAISSAIAKAQELWNWLGNLADKAGGLKGVLDIVTRQAPGANVIGLTNPGAALIESIVKGISKGKVKLQTALDKLKDYILKHQESLTDLLGKRNEILDAFKGFTSSIFSTDLSVGEGEAPKTIQALLDAGAQSRQGAQSFLASVKSLIDKGLSKDLLHDLINAGEAGQDQINLLATGTAEQIQQANADNLATQMALQEAGLAASEALGIEESIRQEQANIKLADTIRDKLKELLDLQDKNTVVELHLDGHRILWSLKKIKRQNGGHLGLGDTDKD